ncbi:single-stranded-DNA-specific exonuclease RecJ [Clostridium tunisiense]|uniref:single-stranded-DNA-specific exonuclease RecJ n=1 Tax=Clostridium tunisiense TaxID=219748 RepID=UPI0002D2DF1E|nr:single-stranded-DNA-specific exonuclease RecJ [Clostridium tunisiense]
MNTIWREKPCSIEVIKQLCVKTNISPITLRVLYNRGIDTEEKIKKFFKGSLRDLHNPFFMKDMENGVNIVKQAIENGEKIIIYGDYDADGVTSTVVLYKGLTKAGAKVNYYIPDREQEGYGMNLDRIEELCKEGYNLILTCDNGISAVNEVRRVKELGMKIVITDHHELPFIEGENNRTVIMPEADAIINPKRPDCEYPFKFLCGAGIAFKFVVALYKAMNIKGEEALELLEFAGMGTICDVVDLVDENRIIAREALRLLTTSKNKGIKALKEVIGIKEAVSCYHVGFNIGPCINATGRLETASLSVDLLLCEDDNEAKSIATRIHTLNKERQDLTNTSVEEVCEIIDNSSIKNNKVIVVYKKDMHESIAGIVAGRIRERYNVPTIILTEGKERPKGSGRSIEGYNMFEEILKCKDLLFKFGGHPMAAGLSLDEDKIEEFSNRLNDNCKLSSQDLIPVVPVDSQLSLQYINYEVVKEFKELAPFGKGNPSPVLMAKKIKIKHIKFLGNENQHVKLLCYIPNTSKTIEGLYFSKGEEIRELLEHYFGQGYMNCINAPGDLYLDLLFEPDINEFNGQRNLQLKLKDVKISR